MSEPRTVRFWNVLGTIYPTIVRKLTKGDEGEYKKGEIRVADNTPPHLFWRTEGHEVFHVACDATGISITLQDVFGLSADVASRIEEEFAHRVLPVYNDTLERNGYLHPPPPPDPQTDGGVE